jgi:hypothetical protein
LQLVLNDAPGVRAVISMHVHDKIPQAACGDLVKTINKVVQNPFTAGTDLMKKMRAIAAHFRFESRINALFTCCDQTMPKTRRCELHYAVH